MKSLFLYLLVKIYLVASTEPPCSKYEFPYKPEGQSDLICLMKCPFGCGYGKCLPDGTCECKMGAIYLKHHKTRKIVKDMCNFQCDSKYCSCFESRCYLGFHCICEPGKTFHEDLDCCINETFDPCKGSCQFGYCAIEGDCKCKEGFKLDPNFTEASFRDDFASKKFEDVPQQCIPFCIQTCPANAKCIMPNVCQCNEGFHANKEKQCV